MVGGHFFGDDVSVSNTVFKSIGRSHIEPHIDSNLVLRDAFAVAVHQAEVELSISITLLGTFREPLKPLFVILRDAYALEVTHAEVYLTSGTALFSGFPKPLKRPLVILKNAFAGVINPAEVVLGFCMPLLGGFHVPLYHF